MVRFAGVVRALGVVLLILALLPDAGRAAVERLEITERRPFADGKTFGDAGAYEVIRGRAHYAVDPALPANARIVDLGKAPRDARGLVTFSGDFVMLRPVDPALARGTLLYEVTNRGGIGILGQLNEARGTPDPRTAEHAGNGFLLREGFTLLWSGWNADVAAAAAGAPDWLRIDLPVARTPDGPITGRVHHEVVPESPAAELDYTGARARGYMPADPDAADAVLSVRDTPDGERRVIPRDRWRFAPGPDGRPSRIRLEGGFEPGRTYEVVFTAADPVVVGLGLASVRDLLAHARRQGIAGHPPPGAVLMYGISQSGRFISHMLYEGLHLDEAGHPAFDGAVVHVAGGGKGSFNHRFAQTTRHFSMWFEHAYPTDFHPFATVPTTDPVGGATASLLDRAGGFVPKLFFTNTSAEYWNRAASLIHTTPDGAADIGAHPHARLYHIAAAQHFVGRQRERGILDQCVSPLNHQFAMRALTLALDGWVRNGTVPPPTTLPRIAEGTLVPVQSALAALPAIPGLAMPKGALRPPRLDHGPEFATTGVATVVPPRAGEPYPTLVPLPGADGIDAGGIVLPQVAVPLGTYLGWNTRSAEAGAAGALERFNGAFIPFARTRAEREAAGDPRPSLEERYGTKEAYLAKLRATAEATAAQGFLIPAEIDALIAEAAGLWDRIQTRKAGERDCGWMFPG